MKGTIPTEGLPGAPTWAVLKVRTAGAGAGAGAAADSAGPTRAASAASRTADRRTCPAECFGIRSYRHKCPPLNLDPATVGQAADHNAPMRHKDAHAVTDPTVVRDLIRANPWATLVSVRDAAAVASHYPVLLDEEADGLVLLTHLGRPDEELHDLDGEMLVIVQGRHGYVSPSWYAPARPGRRPGTSASPTATAYPRSSGGGEPGGADPPGRALRARRSSSRSTWTRSTAREMAPGTVGLRIPVARFTCKRKLSQDKDPVSRRQAIAALRAPGPYHHPELAAEMESELEANRLSEGKR